MPFTDEDLKKLKEGLIGANERTTILGTVEPISMLPNSFAALVERLEAAENFIRLGALTQSVDRAELSEAEARWENARATVD